MQLSLLIGKRILTPQGEGLGYVKGAYLSRDLMRLSCLAVVDQEEEEFYLPLRAVLSCKDALIAGKSRLSSPTGVPAPMGIPAYSNTGEALGTVCDWLFGDVDPVFLVVKDGVRTSYACKQTLAGETLIVYPEGKRPPACKKAAQKSAPKQKAQDAKNAPNDAPMPTVLSNETPMPESARNEAPVSEDPENEAPMSENGQAERPSLPLAAADMGHRDLLGRRVWRTVLDDAGMPIANAGEQVTPAMLARARLYNRLLALTAATLIPIR